tara:strand:- start:1926 stop:6518 length:4593 start_codon:yes stop_codon:yes gene_type:complete
MSGLKTLSNQYTYLSNELDEFDSYTYSLEWFVADKQSTRQFQVQEASLAKTIAGNGWPTVKNNAITIAKTGYTTEFNVTDLSVEAVGVGNSNYSKIAGTAHKLEFTCTQVGNTSLAETLQTAVALCGYVSISDASYFMKINFLGHTDGVAKTISQTKVLPFKIKDYQNVSTSTDVRGTTTVLNGTIMADTVVMNTEVSTAEFGFKYERGTTLEECLKNFMLSLDNSIKNNNKLLDANLKHSYKYTLSEKFKREFGSGSMDGVNEDVNKDMTKVGKNDAIEIGNCLPGQAIYSTIEEICHVSKNLRDEMITDNAGYTKVLNITPYLVLKQNGFNPVKGTQSYNVEYFIDYTLKLVEQNMPDYFTKTKNNEQNTRKIFDDGHVNKYYNFLFTGKNDQIIDFNISLDAELIKVFTSPNDVWSYEDYKKNNDTGVFITKEQEALIEKAQGDFEEASRVFSDDEVKFNTLNTQNTKFVDDSKTNILAAIANKKDMKPEDVTDLYGEMTLEEIFTEFGIKEPKAVKAGRRGPNPLSSRKIGDLDVQEIWRNKKTLEAALVKALATLNNSKANRTKLNEAFTTIQNSVYANQLTRFTPDSQIDDSNNVFNNIRSKKPDSKNIILAEELGDNYITTTTGEEFKNILKAQMQNPITFQRLIQKNSKGGIETHSEAEPTNLQLAKEKYYEAKEGRLSMIFAQMTIKGDPFWIEGYMPPQAKDAIYNGTGRDEGTIGWAATAFNGYPHLVLESKKSSGVDENENVKVAGLIMSLYSVRSITSSFSQGTFTQVLDMVKNSSAEFFPKTDVEVVEELGDGDGAIRVVAGTGADGPAGGAGNGQDIYTDGNLNGNLTGNGTTKVPLTVDQQLAVDMAFENHMNRNDGFPLGGAYGLGVNKTPSDNSIKKFVGETFSTLGETIKKIVTKDPENVAKRMIEKSDEDLEILDEVNNPAVAVNPTQTLGQVNPDVQLLDNANRQNQSLFYLENVKEMRAECASGNAAVCTQLEKSKAELLKTLPLNLTEADVGNPATITAVEDYFNGVIADGSTNSDFNLSVYEIAAYEYALGGKMSITGKTDQEYMIDRIAKRHYGERNAEIIVEELKNEEILDVSSSVGHNALINGKSLLVNEELPEVSIGNVSDKSTIINETVNEARVFNPETRRLEIGKIETGTLTAAETQDVATLNDKINNVINESISTYPTTWPRDFTGQVLERKQEEWFENSAKNLDKHIAEAGITVTEAERTEMLEKIAKKITTEGRVSVLSDTEFKKVEGYATAINTINTNSTSGNRGVVTETVIATKTVTELATLKSEHENLVANMYPNLDPVTLKADMDRKREIELQIAEKELALSVESASYIRTIPGEAGTYKHVPIMGPVNSGITSSERSIVKEQSTGDFILIPPSDNTSAQLAMYNTTTNKAEQINQAYVIYDAITKGVPTLNGEDEFGTYTINDYNNISDISYIDANGDAQTIKNPSNEFGLYTNTYDDHYPGVIANHETLMQDIAKLFPDIHADTPTPLSTSDNGTLKIVITTPKFYIKEKN